MSFPAPGVLMSHAVVLRRTGKQKQAMALLTRGIQRYPDHAALRVSRALLARRLGDVAGARSDALAACEMTLGAAVRPRLVRLLIDLKRPWDAEALLTDASEASELWAVAEVMHAIGAPEDKWRATLAAAQAAPERHETILRNAESVLRSDDPVAATQLVDIGLSADPGHAGLLGIRARALTTLGDPAAADAVTAWEASATGDPEATVAIALLWRQLGELERSAERLEAAAEADPDSAAAWVELAELRLWSLDLDGAEAALGRCGDEAPALRVRGAVTLMRGDAPAALALLDAALAKAPRDALTCTWRSEALAAVGRLPEAVSSADDAIRHSRRFSLSALLNQGIAREVLAAGSPNKPGRSTELAPLVEPLMGHDAELTLETLSEFRRHLGGNRGPDVTRLTSDGLVRYDFPADPRSSARLGQMVFKIRGRAAALATMDALVQSFDGHQLVHTYRGELELWFGTLEGAAADFSASLARDPTTRWAKIGLAAIALLQGDPATCAEQLERGDVSQRGPTAWIYLGEAYRRLGQLERAEATLGSALLSSRSRLSTWMNLALVYAARGDDGPALAIAADVDVQMPDLLPPGPPVERLEAGLTRMHGNRSSSMVTWFDASERLRYFAWAPPAATPDWASRAERLASSRSS